ncbi:hypothetical protein OEZ86_009712 [Tetradesmus obliquus]|uniref:Uncharacterized protein n=1 Tax=Tetradesmus obliquus TaxID=3088 RepID=A0ABY8UN95_TETOB|nr:hypothetical protein OEZ85_001156 [Tetradesmus obliquus]WIA43204.1 hypothetical protein OEZ86_009712 [Tetradesmus obliquus]
MVLSSTIAGLNKAAVAAIKAGDHQQAITLLSQLFQQAAAQHTTHPELFIAHSNKAACHLALGQHREALQDAEACLQLLRAASARAGLLSPSRHPHWPKACQRLGGALLGLGQHRQAAAAFEAGLEADPFNPSLKDVYEYVRTQCDIAAPKNYLHRQLLDAPRLSAWWSATAAAVAAVAASGRQPRVLLLGAKGGLLALAAVRAGAVHVTCVEQSPYLAAACRKVLLYNGVPASSFSVTSSHPTTLQLGRDLPCVCNCLVADIIDNGVLSGGFIPAVAHTLDELLVREEPVIVPAAVTVMAQAVGVRPSGCEVHGGKLAAHCEDGCENVSSSSWLDLSALNKHRWTPSHCLPSPLDPSSFIPLSAPVHVWHMPSLAVAADTSAVAQLDVEMQQTGSWAAVAVWAELQLFGTIRFSTAGEPAYQWFG